jgi:hypothetical protein
MDSSKEDYDEKNDEDINNEDINNEDINNNMYDQDKINMIINNDFTSKLVIDTKEEKYYPNIYKLLRY